MYGDKDLSFRHFIKSKMLLTEQDIEDAIGYRSPCVSLQQYNGTTSPAQGRSVREFEDQMASLRKENFNLKLRLYFIEESIPGYNQSNNTEGQETLMKQLIDSKVEMEILRKEIHEKQDLLKEAAQALNQMEQIQKDTEIKSQAIIEELNHRIQYLEVENKEMEKSQSGKLMDELLGRSDVSSNINAVQKIRELEGIVTQSEEKVNDFQNQIHKLDEILIQRDETIRELEDKVKELVFQNSELLEQLENKDKEIARAERSLEGLRLCNRNLCCEYQTANRNLEAVKTKYFRDMSSLRNYEKTIKCQQETIVGMHAAIATKTKNMAKLLEYIQDYESKLSKLNSEQTITKKENRFFKAILEKLQKTSMSSMDENSNLSVAAKFFPNLLLPNRCPSAFYARRATSSTTTTTTTTTVDYRAVYELKEKLRFDLAAGGGGIRQANSDSSLFCMAGSCESIGSPVLPATSKCQLFSENMVKVMVFILHFLSAWRRCCFIF